MEKERMNQVWAAIRTGYKRSVQYGPHGVTGDPIKLVDYVLDEGGVTLEEVRKTLAVIAKIKAHDGRFSSGNRRWLYQSIEDMTSDDWYMEYCRVLGGLDDIHTAHLNNLVDCMRTYGPADSWRSAKREYLSAADRLVDLSWLPDKFSEAGIDDVMEVIRERNKAVEDAAARVVGLIAREGRIPKEKAKILFEYLLKNYGKAKIFDVVGQYIALADRLVNS